MTNEQKLDVVLVLLDDIVALALNPLCYEEVVACEHKLYLAISRAKLALSFIDGREPQPFKMWRGT